MPDVAALPDTASRKQAQSRALDRSLVRGVAWIAAAKWTSQALSWVSWLVVARLLTAEDYGLVGMAAVYLGLITLLSEFGLGTAVLAVRELSVEQIHQLNGLAVLAGFAGLLVSCAAAAPLGWFFREPQLPLVVVATSATFVVASFKTVPLALLQRDLRFRATALIDLGQALVLAGSLIGLAVAGFGYWTLVGSGVLAALASAGAVLALRPVAFAWPRLGALTHTMALSYRIVVARLCWYFSANADFLVAGRILGKGALGLYNVGWTLASVPVDKIATLVGQVSPAILSAVQHDPPAIRRYVLRITEGIALITFPLAFGLALVARDFVLVVLGPRWEGTVVPLRLLAAYAAIRSITPILPLVLHMLRQARFEMWRMVAAAAVMPAAFYVGGQAWGTAGLALAWIVFDPILLWPLYRRVSSSIGLSARQYLEALWPAASGTAVMAAVVLGIGAFGGGEWTAGARLAAQVGAGAGIYGLVCLGPHRRRLSAFSQLLRATGAASKGAP